MKLKLRRSFKISRADATYKQIRFSFISMFWYLSFFFVRVYFYITIWFWSHDRAHLNLKIVMQAILACIYLLLHLTQQVHHDHSSFSVSVSNSDSTTSTRHHQLVRYIAICQKNTKLKSDPYLAIDTQTCTQNCLPDPTLFRTIAIAPTTFRCLGFSLAMI